MFFSFVDFFKEWPQFALKADAIVRNIYGADWENKLEVCVIYTFRGCCHMGVYLVFVICFICDIHNSFLVVLR